MFTGCVTSIDIKYNKSLDHRRTCFEDELNGGSNNIVQTNQFDAGDKLYYVVHYVVLAITSSLV